VNERAFTQRRKEKHAKAQKLALTTIFLLCVFASLFFAPLREKYRKFS
jgi:hypothetical protein